jgi:glycosyltransferase involved in cell wall biosynthesis
MIRLLYATRANLCLRRAHAHNILSTASSLASDGACQVGVIFSGAHHCTTQEMRARHGIHVSFALRHVRSLMWHIMKNASTFDIYYTRDPRLLVSMALARLLGKKVIFEIHGSHEWPFLHWLWRLAFRIAHAHIFITRALAEVYRPSQKPYAIIPCTGVDLAAFDAPQKQLRQEYGLPPDAFILLYMGGSQGIYYNARILIDMMALLPRNHILFLVGLKDVSALQISNRIKCIGRVNPTEIPSYLRGADILLNPKVKGYAGSISSKLYEYLAAGKPIVASVVPADREVINEHNALIVEPTADAFSRAIMELYENQEKRERLGREAREDAMKYTWEQRREKLRSFIRLIRS